MSSTSPQSSSVSQVSQRLPEPSPSRSDWSGLNRPAQLLAVIGAGLTVVYPFIKRFVSIPQFVLGAAFGWAVPMAFAAQTGETAQLAWLVFGILLWGRHFRGWRGRLAVRMTLVGMVILLLSYFGSKLVLEIILGSSWQS